jgi:hypothetical protein
MKDIILTMDSKKSTWRLQDGVIDLQKEYIEIRYGDVSDSSAEDWIPVALVGRPENNVFPVQWLVGTDNPDYKSMKDDVRRELNYYLVELGEPDPWAYAQYHCTTASNLYSSVHWSYYPEGDKEGKHLRIIKSRSGKS